MITVLQAAAGGPGHPPIALANGLPATTVRDWTRRARGNAEAVRRHATILAYALDPFLAPLEPAGSPLGDMLEAVGVVLRAATLRLVWRLGFIVELGGTDPEPGGYDLRGAFVGSEGMCGIATKICVRLTQNPPGVFARW